MGSGGSKGCCSGGGTATVSSSTPSSSGNRSVSAKAKNRIFRSSCLGALSRSASPKPNFDNRKESETAVRQSPSRCLSGFSFRLNRANSSRSVTEYPVSPSGPAMLNRDDSSRSLDPQPRQRNSCSSITVNESDVISDPVENNARFSRALSVGRLRDRVINRASLLSPSQQDVELISTTNHHTQQLATTSTHETETPRSREARYHDLLHNRSNFLERRRRIRSQVRALQRLGSRFENFSGHERSCILSGQHRSGRCTCRVNNRDSSSNDDTTGARSSVSRIVMLAEALFEVLDEIHQQSVVLSFQPTVSSIGSVPAPNEVVESLPVKIYKSHKLKNDEAVQCYICLVEYEEGDSIRRLPCNHEFHRTCIDKWLKEIHRVCPLCRGDICGPDRISSGK